LSLARLGLTFLVFSISWSACASELKMYGTLTPPICRVATDFENITVDFGPVNARNLFSKIRTNGIPFNIVLTDCEERWGGRLTVTIAGDESLGLPGFLAVSTGGTPTGIAIGIETTEGKHQPINVPGKSYQYFKGETVISMAAYLQAEPSALQNREMVAGSFFAIGQFTLIYN
jgi:type 1 fimbria pilin